MDTVRSIFAEAVMSMEGHLYEAYHDSFVTCVLSVSCRDDQEALERLALAARHFVQAFAWAIERVNIEVPPDKQREMRETLREAMRSEEDILERYVTLACLTTDVLEWAIKSDKAEEQ